MNTVFGQLLYAQWKASRWVVLPIALLSFIVPLAAVSGAERRALRQGFTPGVLDAADLLNSFQVWVPAFPILAVLTGAVVALTAWSWDHRVNHVYALSLPISRSRYALNKMLAGFAPLLLPTLLLLVGSVIAAYTITLPAGVRAYPFALTFRFFLCAAVVYALVFSLGAGSVRTLVLVILALVVVFTFGGLVVDTMERVLEVQHLRTPGEVLYDALVTWPGPFSVLGGNWLLLDV